DPKGKNVPVYLRLLSNHLSDERADIANELQLLTEKVGHVKAIVATQQSYAGVSSVLETVDLATTIEDAIKLRIVSFERDKVVVEKRLSSLPKISIDKQRVLQILVNLLKNAGEALCEESPAQRRIVVRSAVSDDNMLQIQVEDNGIGVRPENLTR